MTDANRHLLTYAVWDQSKRCYFYPFVRHARWAHWAHDTAERHRLNGQKSMFVKKHDNYANMTKNDLREMIQQGGEE
jgi:hypothetical protein